MSFFKMTKLSKFLPLLAPLCLVVLFGCTHEEDYVGTYKSKRKYGEETVTLYPDHSFCRYLRTAMDLIQIKVNGE